MNVARYLTSPRKPHTSVVNLRISYSDIWLILAGFTQIPFAEIIYFKKLISQTKNSVFLEK